MVPLLGPLAPVLLKVHDALELCLLSTEHYADAPPPRPPHSAHGRQGSGGAAGGTPTGEASEASERSQRIHRRSGGGGGGGMAMSRRVPYFALVRLTPKPWL